MNYLLNSYVVVVFLLGAISTSAQTAVLFGASGTVGSEVLQSLLNDSSFQDVILIVRKSSPKVDEILSNKKNDAPNVTTVILADLNADLDSYNALTSADACFVATGVGDINKATLQYLHSVEVDMIGSITRFCDKLRASTLTLLSAVDVDYESAVSFSEEEIHAEYQKPLGWMKGIGIYYQMMGLKEKAVVTAAKNMSVRIFQPSSILTKEYRYGAVDRIIFAMHSLLDPYIPTKYHSVDVTLLGMAMVLDAERMLQQSTLGDDDFPERKRVTKLTYANFLRYAGEAFKEQQETKKDEL
mmetsp:Transcript_16490/g.39478  ORF Transcript_16490/g.39478 Transcript_16490/m.39478 type:complete len:299 (+) Transcript_16490:44-940(+)